jgi:peptidoglycan/xylan/chitin deacetylase (PgdA/CDA1 family)
MSPLETLMRRVTRAAASATLRGVPTDFWRRLFPKTAIGVCYHMVSDAAVPHLRHYPFLDQTAFEADLAYLQRHFTIMHYPDLARRRAAGDGTRRNEVVVTFDDGFAECAGVAAPILRRRGIGAVFFVITDLIDNATMFRESEASLCIGAIRQMKVAQVQAIARSLDLDHLPAPEAAMPGGARTRLDLAGLEQGTDPLLWPLLQWLLTISPADTGKLHALASTLGIDTAAYLQHAQPYLSTQQIRQLHEDGFTIGAHSRSHRWLQSLSREEAEQEIVESCRIVRDITGQDSVPFAFPYFGGGLDRAWLADIRARHEGVGLFFDTDGVREDAPFVVQRVFGERFGHDTTLDAILRRAWSRPAAWRRHYATGRSR